MLRWFLGVVLHVFDLSWRAMRLENKKKYTKGKHRSSKSPFISWWYFIEGGFLEVALKWWEGRRNALGFIIALDKFYRCGVIGVLDCSFFVVQCWCKRIINEENYAGFRVKNWVLFKKKFPACAYIAKNTVYLQNNVIQI